MHRSKMSLQNFTLIERKWTVGTFIRSFASMSPFMTNNFGRCSKPFATELTSILLSAIKKLLILRGIHLLLILWKLLLLLLTVERGGPTPSLTTTTTTPWAYLQ